MSVKNVFKIVNLYTEKFEDEIDFRQWIKKKANYIQVPYSRRRKSGVSERKRDIYVLKTRIRGRAFSRIPAVGITPSATITVGLI